ncbi:LysR family transcriptional regulator [Rhodobacterales bacterium HKCCE3408]|nr:LysR family transcriptional regulator [Rhodobacterales bacterium HKCCE3408]
MDIPQLRTFLAVAETGSFSNAAARLNSVQSNVTHRIRKLEDGIGGPLFERGRGGARLTPLGERMLPHARDILARLSAAEADLKDAAGGAAPFRLGALDTTAGARLPPILTELVAAYPAADITLQTGANGDLTAAVQDRRLDAAFVGGPVDRDRFHAIHAFTETLVMVRSRATEAPDRLLAFPSGCIYRAAAETHFRSLGRGDLTIRDMGSLDGILGLVAAGLGFAVAPAASVGRYPGLEALDITPLPGPLGQSDTWLIRRHDHRPTAAHELLNILVEDD